MIEIKHNLSDRLHMTDLMLFNLMPHRGQTDVRCGLFDFDEVRFSCNLRDGRKN